MNSITSCIASQLFHSLNHVKVLYLSLTFAAHSCRALSPSLVGTLAGRHFAWLLVFVRASQSPVVNASPTAKDLSTMTLVWWISCFTWGSAGFALNIALAPAMRGFPMSPAVLPRVMRRYWLRTLLVQRRLLSFGPEVPRSGRRRHRWYPRHVLDGWGCGGDFR